jgi:uncharacterized membrane protein YfcA
VVVTAVLPLFINVVVIWDSWRDADRRMVLALLLLALAGVVVGVEVLRVVDPEYIRLAVSLVVVFSALLLLREVRLPEAESRWGPVVAGSTSGALSSSTALAGAPRHLWLVLALVPVGFLGKILGTTRLKRTSERAFRVVSLGVMILTGALGVATAL